MSLFRAELRRFVKRRVTRLMLLLVLLGLAAIALSFTAASQRIGPEQVAAAETRAQREYEQQLANYRQMVAECEAAKARGEDVTRQFPPECGKDVAAFGPPREAFQAEGFLGYEFNFRAQFELFISVFAGILALFAFVVGASYVGAEWSTGGMMNLLLWRPKRLSVLLTKLGALLVGVLGLGVALGALWTTAFWLIGRYDGQLGKLTPGVWQSFAITGARGLGIVLAVAAVGFGLASLGRHTAMALGAAVAIGVVSEIGLRIVMGVAGVSMGDRFLLSTYALAWFAKRWTVQDWKSCQFTMGECRPKQLLITWQDSALVFGVGAAVILALAMWTMRRRDIT